MNNIIIALTMNIAASIPDDMDPQYAADNLSVSVNTDDEDISVSKVSTVSSAPVVESAKKIWCPHCGLHHVPTPVKYKVENEYETFQEELKEFETEDEGENTIITLPSAHIEAGPYNGDRFLMDYDVKACSCPSCKATFYIE